MVTIECICPPKATGEPRHPAGDTITLRERLGFVAALTARNTIRLIKSADEEASTAEILAALTETYLRLGIVSWTVVDAKNKPVPVSTVTIREYLLVGHPDAAMEVGDAADELYSAAVILPLLARGQTSSPPTPIKGSTSAKRGSSTRPPKPSRPSSTITSPTVAIETTSSSPAGDSSSSLNSA